MKSARRIFSAVVLVGLFFSPLFHPPHSFASSGASPVDGSPESSNTVYVTKSGKKYHRAGCRSLKKTGTPIELSRARQSKTPCKVCKPRHE